MKKLNKVYIFFAILGLVLVGTTTFSKTKEADSIQPSKLKSNQINLATGHAKAPYYENLTDLEKSADVIVKGKMVGEGSVIDFKQSGVIVDSVTKSSFLVNKVYKGELQEKSNISIFEPAAFKKNIYVNTDGYKLMDKKGQYVLFLDKNPNGDYMILGLYQGKFDLTKGVAKETKKFSFTTEEFNQIEYFGEQVEHFNKLKGEVSKKYN
jgi:hypothetical protein